MDYHPQSAVFVVVLKIFWSDEKHISIQFTTAGRWASYDTMKRKE